MKINGLQFNEIVLVSIIKGEFDKHLIGYRFIEKTILKLNHIIRKYLCIFSDKYLNYLGFHDRFFKIVSLSLIKIKDLI